MKRTFYVCGLFILIQFVISTPGAHAQYQIEETLGAPYVQSIYPSTDRSSLAWVTNEKGVRNIWHTAVSNISSTKVTSFDQDDGQNISNISISGNHLFFVVGNGNNRYGESANPASLPKKPQRQILRLDLGTSTMDTVDIAGNPSLSPDGEMMIYSKQSAVYIIRDVSSQSLDPELLFEVRRGVGQLTWSHDSRSVAFTSNRSDHSFVGVYSLDSEQITWMEPSLYFDSDPTWSPNNEKVAFVRRRGANKDELYNLMSGHEFEIVTANTEDGKGQTIWNSQGPYGGFAQYYPATAIRWTKMNKILFYSEHDGWNHIYSINPDGTEIKDLTPGECEVENHDVSEDGKVLYVTRNCSDINKRNIWQIDIASGRSELITDASAIQTHPVALTGGVAFREGTFNRPTGAVISVGGSTEVLGSMPSEFPEEQFVVPQPIQFKSADGLTIHGQLFVPKGLKSRDKVPAVIFMHGGPIRQMLLGYHYSHYYANAYVMNQYLARQGYVVLSVNFRNGIGYGRDFRLDKNQGPRGASEYKDILAAGKYLQSRTDVNPEKIGLWGGSYGGYLTAMGLAKNSDLFKAGVDLHGVHDWAWRGRDFSPGGAWGISDDLMDLAYHSSPISELQYWSSPVLIVHGDDDRNVMFGQSIDLKNKLDEIGVYNEVLVFPDEVHGFLRYDSWLRTYEATFDFFERFLKD